MNRLDNAARLWNHGRADPEDTMYEAPITLHINANWTWIIAFAQSIAPLINIETGELGQVAENEARVFVAIPAHGSPYQNNQCTLAALIRQRGPGYTTMLGMVPGGLIIINQNEVETEVFPTYDTGDNPFWYALLGAIEKFANEQQVIKRAAVGTQFTAILDQYYDLKSEGRKVKLAELARRYNVNYASLRQAKIRYDQKLYKGDITDPDSGEPDVAGLHID